MYNRIFHYILDDEEININLDTLYKIEVGDSGDDEHPAFVTFYSPEEKTTVSINSQEAADELQPFIHGISKYIKDGILTPILKNNSYLQNVELNESTIVGSRLKEDDTQQTDDDQQDDQQQGGDDAAAEQPEDNGVDVDPTVDSGDQVAGAAQAQQSTGGAPMEMPAAAPIPAGATTANGGGELELADGTDTQVARDSALQYDAINPQGEASISFKSGNYNHINELPQNINQKVTTITRTIMPLCEAALIELLGNNKAYKGQDFQATFSMSPEGQPTFECHAEYIIEGYIGTDIPQEDIADDAKYILNRLQVVPGVQWNECSIDVTEGSFKLGFII